MKFIFLCLLAILFSASPTFAQKKETVKLFMGGMHCEACAETVEFKFKEQDAVETINADLDTQVVTITLKSDQDLSEDTIRGIVNWSGFDLYVIERH
ncbi:MAG: heavy-metal-associated domain-containing protein [Pseudomonadota bacterium]